MWNIKSQKSQFFSYINNCSIYTISYSVRNNQHSKDRMTVLVSSCKHHDCYSSKHKTTYRTLYLIKKLKTKRKKHKTLKIKTQPIILCEIIDIFIVGWKKSMDIGADEICASIAFVFRHCMSLFFLLQISKLLLSVAIVCYPHVLW